MSPTAPPSWIEVDLHALDHNLAVFREVLGEGPRICGVVKADGYGLGATAVAQRLASRGVGMMAVYYAEQARDLMQGGYTGSILVMGVLDQLQRGEMLYRAAATDRLHLTIHSVEQLQQINTIGQLLGCRFPVHLFLDTGMSRGGLSDNQFGAAVGSIRTMRHITLAGVSSHMASSDDDPAFTEAQYARLDRAITTHRDQIGDDVIIHAANTFTALRDRRYHRDMVRLGLGLYGFGPDLLEGGVRVNGVESLRPAVRWCARIVHIQRYARGTGVGYNQTCHLTRDSNLGLIPVGYADGYHLGLGNKAHVRLPALNAHAAVLGKVNMDQIVIDLTDTPAAKFGDEVELYSNDPASLCAVPRLAQLAGSNCYEMLTNMKPHLPRQYVR